MFTGIIRHIGTVQNTATADDGAVEFDVATDLAADLREGDSVAVNGVCLTIVSKTSSSWRARLMAETLKKTNLGELADGTRVNLERPLSMGSGLDGHFVQGHVDGVCEVVAIQVVGDDKVFSFRPPAEILPYLVPKGSVALDGVSLTVVDVDNDTFSVSMMPYTLEHTVFGSRRVGDNINIEADMLGKYVVQTLDRYRAHTASP